MVKLGDRAEVLKIGPMLGKVGTVGALCEADATVIVNFGGGAHTGWLRQDEVRSVQQNEDDLNRRKAKQEATYQDVKERWS